MKKFAPMKIATLSAKQLAKASGGENFRIRGWTNCNQCGAGWNHWTGSHPDNGCVFAGVAV